MCGISGFVSQTPVNPKFIEVVNNVAKYRGPDDEGYFLSNSVDDFFEHYHGNDSNSYQKKTTKHIKSNTKLYNFGFGHRRLSIIDTSISGFQPFSKHDLVVVFNGEIFNYLEIRKELISKGYKFDSQSDTEVILSSYDHWGIDCFEKFNGMWSIAIFDIKNKKLVLSRDRFGIKPLYFYKDGDLLLFSSEIKQILSYGIKPIVNKNTLAQYIYSKVTMFNNETMFDGINSVPPGTYAIIESEFLSLDIDFIKYYSLKNSKSSIDQSYGVKVNLLRDLFVNSVEIRLRSDVPLAVSLSGGLDSSLITSVSNQLLKKNDHKKRLNVFSMVAKDSKYDESYFSDKVASATDSIKHNVYPNAEDLEGELEKIIWHHEEPFQSFSVYAGWQIMREVSSRDVKVILGGQGADEVFLGYEVYYVYAIKYYLKKLKLLNALTLSIHAIKKSKLTIMDFVKNFVYYGVPFVKIIYKKMTLTRYLNNSFKNSLRFPNELIKFNSMIDLEDIHSKSIYMGLQRLLNWEDRNSMAHSIEARLPFLDHRVVDFACELNLDELLRDGWLKSIIRSVSDEYLESEISYRKNKIGFDTPDELILNGLSDAFINDLLNDPRTKDVFKIQYLRDCFSFKRDSEARFTFIILEVWARAFSVNFD